MTEKQFTIVVEPNTEDPEIGGFFASFIDGWGRGFGATRLESMFNLILLKGEQEDENWDAQAGDVVVTSPITNAALEQALERRYGGRIDYIQNRPLSA